MVSKQQQQAMYKACNEGHVPEPGTHFRECLEEFTAHSAMVQDVKGPQLKARRFGFVVGWLMACLRGVDR